MIVKWNDPYMLNIYDEMGFKESGYPLTTLGIVLFLQRFYHVHISIWKTNGYYNWAGAIIEHDMNDVFSEDFTEYKEFDDAVNAAIVESACYASVN